MKTKTVISIIFVLINLNSFSQSWSDPICNGDDIIFLPNYERSCTNNSNAFNDYWKKLSYEYYIPDNHTPIKTILVNFNVFLSQPPISWTKLVK